SFNLAAVLPRRSTHRVNCGTEGVDTPGTRWTSFRAGTTRVSNPVCSPSFRASASGKTARALPSPSVFLRISTHFTAPPGIPRPSPSLKPHRLGSPLPGKPRDFTPHAHGRLRTLYAQ